jgi:hypothetical protein
MPEVTGTYRLVKAVARDAAGNVLPAPYGGNPLGRVVLGADGRMIALTCDASPSLPAGAKREYSSYTGMYSFDGETLVTKVDGASDPARIGSEQVRGVRFEDGLMVLQPPLRPYGAAPEQRELYWEKISDV